MLDFSFLIIPERGVIFFHFGLDYWITAFLLRRCDSVKGHTFESKWLLSILLMHKQAFYFFFYIKLCIHIMSSLLPIRLVVASAVQNHHID